MSHCPGRSPGRLSRIAVVVLVAESNRLESLEPLVPAVLQALKTIAPKTLVRVGV